MRKLAAGALLAIGVVAACGPIGRRFVEPVVTLKEARVTGLGLSGGSVEVILDVYNPNSFRLDGSRLTYNVMIDSIQLGQGEYNSRFQVERGDTSSITLPLTFTYAGIGQAGRQLMQTGSVEYRVSGDVTVGTPIGNFTRPYDQKRRFSTLTR